MNDERRRRANSLIAITEAIAGARPPYTPNANPLVLLINNVAVHLLALVIKDDACVARGGHVHPLAWLWVALLLSLVSYAARFYAVPPPMSVSNASSLHSVGGGAGAEPESGAGAPDSAPMAWLLARGLLSKAQNSARVILHALAATGCPLDDSLVAPTPELDAAWLSLQKETRALFLSVTPLLENDSRARLPVDGEAFIAFATRASALADWCMDNSPLPARKFIREHVVELRSLVDDAQLRGRWESHDPPRGAL